MSGINTRFAMGIAGTAVLMAGAVAVGQPNFIGGSYVITHYAGFAADLANAQNGVNGLLPAVAAQARSNIAANGNFVGATQGDTVVGDGRRVSGALAAFNNTYQYNASAQNQAILGNANAVGARWPTPSSRAAAGVAALTTPGQFGAAGVVITANTFASQRGNPGPAGTASSIEILFDARFNVGAAGWGSGAFPLTWGAFLSIPLANGLAAGTGFLQVDSVVTGTFRPGLAGGGLGAEQQLFTPLNRSAGTLGVPNNTSFIYRSGPLAAGTRAQNFIPLTQFAGGFPSPAFLNSGTEFRLNGWLRIYIHNDAESDEAIATLEESSLPTPGAASLLALAGLAATRRRRA